MARTGKTASVFCSALFTLSASLLPAESLLSVPQPAKGRDPGDGEGPVRPPRRQHFKCESCSDAPYGLSTARPLIHLSPSASSPPDRTGQVQSAGAALQTRPDRRRELGHPRGAGLRHPEVRHGPQTHALLHHRAVRRVDADQRFGADWPLARRPRLPKPRVHNHPLTAFLSRLVFQALENDY